MQIKIDPSAYSSKFEKILYSWDRYIIAYGSRGSSKTDCFFMKYLIELFEPFYFKLGYINKEGSNIRDQQYAGFKRVAKRMGLYDNLKFYDGDYRIINPKNDNMLIPKGMDDPEKTKGFDDVTAIWWDEANKGTIEDFRALNELLRSPMATYLQFALSFNPVNINHWLRHTFFHPENAHAVHPDFKGQLLLHRSTFRDNEFIDQEAYLKTLLLSAAGNKNTIRVNIEGDWGQEENENPWLHAFDEDKHVVDDIPMRPAYPVYLSFDFNREPLTCIAFQMSSVQGTEHSFVDYIKEFSADIQLEELCKRIKQTYPYSILYVTGDASGDKGDVAFSGRNETYYTMIKRYLHLTDKAMNLNRKNLTHNDSRSLCNMMLANYPSVKISRKGCPQLIEDCFNAKLDTEKGEGRLLKDREDNKNDLLDCFRYSVQTYFLKFVNKVYLGLNR